MPSALPAPESVIVAAMSVTKTVSLVASSSLLAHHASKRMLRHRRRGGDRPRFGSRRTIRPVRSWQSSAEEFNRGAVVPRRTCSCGSGVHHPRRRRPGSKRATIRVRGAASLNASNDPLVVIDGVPIAVDGGKGYGQPAGDDQPQPITESFTVLMTLRRRPSTVRVLRTASSSSPKRRGAATRPRIMPAAA